MPTTGAFNGTQLLVYCAGNAIAYSKSCTLNRNVATIDVTTKTDNGDTNILPGLRDWSIDAEGVVALDSN